MSVNEVTLVRTIIVILLQKNRVKKLSVQCLQIKRISVTTHINLKIKKMKKK